MVTDDKMEINSFTNLNLESSSNKKELLTALFESSAINALMLEITCQSNIRIANHS